jgi:hypothetical protein
MATEVRFGSLRLEATHNGDTVEGGDDGAVGRENTSHPPCDHPNLGERSHWRRRVISLSIKSLVPAADAVVSQDILKILLKFTHIF